MGKGAKRRGRGEGGLEELPNGTWRAVVSFGVDPKTQKRVRLSRTFDTKREAAEWRDETTRQKRAGEITITATTVGEWLDTWLEIRRPAVEANTYRTEADTVKNHLRPGLGPVKLKELTPLSLERWLAKLDTSQNNRRKAAKLLRKVLADAVARKVMGSNPMAVLKIPKRPDAESAALTAGQLGALIGAAREVGRGAPFALWADAGLQPGELYGLVWDDFDSGVIKVRRSICTTTGRVKGLKTNQRKRNLKLAPSTAAALEALRGAAPGDSPIFPTPTGKHWWHRNFVRDVFDPIATAAGLKGLATPYVMRHTMASLLLQRGVSLKVVSERLGHADVTTTLKHYSHVLPGMQEAAAAVMESILNPPAEEPR